MPLIGLEELHIHDVSSFQNPCRMVSVKFLSEVVVERLGPEPNCFVVKKFCFMHQIIVQLHVDEQHVPKSG